MSTADATDDVVGALKLYFSGPIAKALLTSTLRRAKIDAAPLDPARVPEVVTALERALPSYIADEARRTECAGKLRGLLGKTPSEPSTPASTNARASVRQLAAAPPSIASTVVRVKTADDVANACEAGRDLARRIGFAHLDQTKIATAISELARNVLLYAGDGEIRISSVDGTRRGIEITSIDAGPGIGNLDLVMSDAYRSRTGMGKGLKGVRRLTDVFDIASSPHGTTVVARKFRS